MVSVLQVHLVFKRNFEIEFELSYFIVESNFVQNEVIMYNMTY